MIYSRCWYVEKCSSGFLSRTANNRDFISCAVCVCCYYLVDKSTHIAETFQTCVKNRCHDSAHAIHEPRGHSRAVEYGGMSLNLLQWVYYNHIHLTRVWLCVCAVHVQFQLQNDKSAGRLRNIRWQNDNHIIPIIYRNMHVIAMLMHRAERVCVHESLSIYLIRKLKKCHVRMCICNVKFKPINTNLTNWSWRKNWISFSLNARAWTGLWPRALQNARKNT